MSFIDILSIIATMSDVDSVPIMAICSLSDILREARDLVSSGTWANAVPDTATSIPVATNAVLESLYILIQSSIVI